MEQQECSLIAGENPKWYSHLEYGLTVSYKTKPCDPAIMLLGIYPKELRTWAHMKHVQGCLLAVSFKTANMWKQSGNPIVNKGLRNCGTSMQIWGYFFLSKHQYYLPLKEFVTFIEVNKVTGIKWFIKFLHCYFNFCRICSAACPIFHLFILDYVICVFSVFLHQLVAARHFINLFKVPALVPFMFSIVFWIFPTFSGDIFLIFLFYEFWNPSIKGKTPIVLFYKTSDSPVSQFTPRPDFSFPSPTKKASWGV